MEPREAFTELLREDVPPGAGPLSQLNEGRARCLSDPQESVQPVRRPASRHKNQGGENEERPKLQKENYCSQTEAKEKYKFVHLDFSQRLFVGDMRQWESCFLASGCTG